jgi:lysine-N-methylase
VPNPQGNKRSDFARIRTSSTAACFFLEEDRLCGIQKQLGPTFLSVTCAIYPRSVVVHAGIEERSLTLSCPEAARLTLLHGDLLGGTDPQAGTILDTPHPLDTPGSPWRAASPARYTAFFHEAERVQQAERLANDGTSEPLSSELPAELLPEPIPAELIPYDPQLATRDFALLLLTDRSYPLWQRLLLLGTVARQLRTLSQGGSEATFAVAHPETIAQLLADGATVVSQNQLRAVMDEIEIQPAEQLPLILDLLRLRVSQPPIAPRFLECLQEFEAGLGSTTATSEAQLLANFAHAYRSYVRPLLERHPHLLENYLTNYVFRNNYPFAKLTADKVANKLHAPSADAADDQPCGKPQEQAAPASRSAASVPGDQTDAGNEHLLLCTQLALLQTMLIGMAAHHREAFDPTHVVKLVQSLSKTVEHSKPFLRQISTFIAQRNLNTLRGIALLLQPPECGSESSESES